jgi:MFS family permease
LCTLRPLVIGGLAGAIGLGWFALAGHLIISMAAVAIAVAGLLLLDVVNTTLIQRIVPDELRGRAMGVLQTTSAILYSLGSLLMPLLASAFGVLPVLLGSAAVTASGVGVALALSRTQPRSESIDVARARLFDHPIFAGLPPARLEAAARSLVAVPMAPADVLVRQGDPATRFFLIGDGAAAVTQSTSAGAEDVHLRDLGPGDIFGEIGLLRRSPRTATVTATAPGTLFALEADAFRELVGSGPGLSSRLLDLYRGALAR